MAMRISSSSLNPEGSITDVPGIRVGHAQDLEARTGCTVVLCSPEGAAAGVDVRGSAPGTRETDLLEPGNLVDRVHAVVLTGGSVFGLDAACGVTRYLEERGIGFDTGSARVPIVPAAVIYDLAVGDAGVRPDSRMGFEACERATDGPVDEGRVGAGAGATVGKILGPGMASPGGVGTASARVGQEARIGVLVVVNAFGDIIDPETGGIVAGARHPEAGRPGSPLWLNTAEAIRKGLPRTERAEKPSRPPGIENTTLAVVAANVQLSKSEARKVASMSHDGLARAIRPVHTMFDGDTVFVLSTGTTVLDVTTVGSVASDLLSRAIVRATL